MPEAGDEEVTESKRQGVIQRKKNNAAVMSMRQRAPNCHAKYGLIMSYRILKGLHGTRSEWLGMNTIKS